MSVDIRRTVTVSPDGKIEVAVPELPPGSIATITITIEEAPQPKRSIFEILDALPGHRLFHTVEKVDAYIREERDSWDDE